MGNKCCRRNDAVGPEPEGAPPPPINKAILEAEDAAKKAEVDRKAAQDKVKQEMEQENAALKEDIKELKDQIQDRKDKGYVREGDEKLISDANADVEKSAKTLAAGAEAGESGSGESDVSDE